MCRVEANKLRLEILNQENTFADLLNRKDNEIQQLKEIINDPTEVAVAKESIKDDLKEIIEKNKINSRIQSIQ